MNAIVKTFIFINFFLSVFYCAFQLVLFTSRQDWKAKHQDSLSELNIEKEKSSKKIAELDELLKNKELAYNGLSDKATALESSLQTLQAKLDSELSDLKNVKQELGEKSIRVSTLEENVTKRTEELSDVREQLAKAREGAETSRSNLIDLRELVVVYEKEKGKLLGSLEIAQSKLNKQEEELKEHSRLMARLESRGIKVDEILAGSGVESDKPINAKILSVRTDANVVLLSVGREDKVREGYQFTIYNGGTYKGKVMVESVYPNMCSARILKDLMADTETIQEGDNASTRVY
jgi:uncharacterized phage infection (PIP) family protein YhgE